MFKVAMNFFRRNPILFPAAIIALFYIVLLGQPWLPLHDSFGYLLHAHYTLSHLLKTGEIPLWAPYLDWGRNLHFWHLGYFSPSMIFVSTISLPILKLVPTLNLATVVYVGFLLDELILLLGTFLLAKSLFSRIETVLFVTLSVTGTVVWHFQKFFNFSLYYAIPLCLALILRGCREQKAKYVLQGFLIQIITGLMGGALYLTLIQTIVCLIYLILNMSLIERSVKRMLGSLKAPERALISLMLLILLVFVLFLIQGGKPQSLAPGRDPKGNTSYVGFLTYGIPPLLSSFSEFINGLILNGDNSLYGGALIIPFAILTVLQGIKTIEIPLMILLGFIFLFAVGSGSLVAPLLYYFPGVKLFRHVGLTVSLAKLFLIFLAGFGFEKWIDKARKNGNSETLASLIIILCLSFGITILQMYNGYSALPRSLMVSATFATYLIFFFSLFMRKGPPSMGHLKVLFLFLVVDVCSYRSYYYHLALLHPPPTAFWEMFKARPISVLTQRTEYHSDSKNFRIAAPFLYGEVALSRKSDKECLETGKNCPLPVISGAVYNSFEQFLDIDACRPWFRQYSSLPWVYELYQLIGLPRPIQPAQSTSPRTLPSGFRKIIGCELSKFQVHESAIVLPSPQDIQSRFMDPGFSGDSLFASSVDLNFFNDERKSMTLPAVEKKSSLIEWRDLSQKTNDHRTLTSAKVDVLSLTPNRVTLSVETPKSEKDYWLYYADGWHPSWRAYVNTKHSPILQANVAFKSVPIPSGHAEVEFLFSSWEEQCLLYLLIVIAIIFTGWLFLFAFRAIRDNSFSCALRPESHIPRLDGA